MDTTTKDATQGFFEEDDLPDSLTKDEFKKIFEKDDEGRYVNLVIPPMFGKFPGMDLRGKRPEDFTSVERFARHFYRIELRKIQKQNEEVPAYGNC